jgi:hypothetical protein
MNDEFHIQYRIFRYGIWRGNRDNGLKRLWFPLWFKYRKTLEGSGDVGSSDLLQQSLFKSKLKYDMPTDSIRANFLGWNSVSSVAYQKRKRDHPNNNERPEEDLVRGSELRQQ